jgi:hypothetical protein
MTAIPVQRQDSARALTWIEVGSVAGAAARDTVSGIACLPLQIVGSGQGSVSTRDILSELPAIAEAIGRGALRTVDARAVPLSEVAAAWQDTSDAARIVLTP